MALGISDAVELAGKVTELVKKGITIDLQERVMELREAVLNAKDEVLALREENSTLKEQANEKEKWDERAATYTLVQTEAGGMVYRTEGPPEHYACPNCWGQRDVSILQDRRTHAGTFVCPRCDKNFPVRRPRQNSPQVQTRGSWMDR